MLLIDYGIFVIIVFNLLIVEHFFISMERLKTYICSYISGGVTIENVLQVSVFSFSFSLHFQSPNRSTTPPLSLMQKN